MEFKLGLDLRTCTQEINGKHGPVKTEAASIPDAPKALPADLHGMNHTAIS